MNICVVGWYYRPEFYEALLAHREFRVEVVAHRTPPDYLTFEDVHWLYHENVGLEWGAYDYYLRGMWDQKSPVLFMHDDAVVAYGFFQRVEQEAKPFDLAFVFRDGDEERDNCGVHGRCVYMSQRLLTRFRPIGFNYDNENHGDLIGPGYNKGIHRFREDVVWMKNRPSGADLRYGSIFVHADFGYRGKMGAEGQAVRNQMLVAK